jgi:hypothetical protein
VARIRTIKPELWSSERFGECSPLARLLFVAALNFADDAGNLDRSAKQLKAQALPYDAVDADALVAELLACGLFIEYQVLDKFYLHIKNFQEHQKIDHPSRSRLPAYDTSASPHRQASEPSEILASPRAVREGKGREGKGREGISQKDMSGKPDQVLEVFRHWRLMWDHPRSGLDSKRRSTITKALQIYGADQLCQAISGYKNSPHHTGQNDRNTVYDDIGLFLRDSAHIDAGIRFAEHPPDLSSSVTQHNVAVLKDWSAPPENDDETNRRPQISSNTRQLR